MTTLIAWLIIIFVLTLPFRIAGRLRARRVTPPPQVVIVVQPAGTGVVQMPTLPGPPSPPVLTLEEELARIIQTQQDGTR